MKQNFQRSFEKTFSDEDPVIGPSSIHFRCVVEFVSRCADNQGRRPESDVFPSFLEVEFILSETYFLTCSNSDLELDFRKTLVRPPSIVGLSTPCSSIQGHSEEFVYEASSDWSTDHVFTVFAAGCPS